MGIYENKTIRYLIILNKIDRGTYYWFFYFMKMCVKIMEKNKKIRKNNTKVVNYKMEILKQTIYNHKDKVL